MVERGRRKRGHAKTLRKNKSSKVEISKMGSYASRGVEIRTEVRTAKRI